MLNSPSIRTSTTLSALRMTVWFIQKARGPERKAGERGLKRG